MGQLHGKPKQHVQKMGKRKHSRNVFGGIFEFHFFVNVIPRCSEPSTEFALFTAGVGVMLLAYLVSRSMSAVT